MHFVTTLKQEEQSREYVVPRSNSKPLQFWARRIAGVEVEDWSPGYPYDHMRRIVAVAVYARSDGRYILIEKCWLEEFRPSHAVRWWEQRRIMGGQELGNHLRGPLLLDRCPHIFRDDRVYADLLEHARRETLARARDASPELAAFPCFQLDN